MARPNTVYVTPEEIINFILEEMEAGTCPSYYSNLVPSVYEVYLYGEDFESVRPLEQRMRYGFIHTYKPVLDDAPFRAFDTMEDYRQWCEKNLPDWLGYGRV